MSDLPTNDLHELVLVKESFRNYSQDSHKHISDLNESESSCSQLTPSLDENHLLGLSNLE